MEDIRHVERVIDIMETFNTNVSEGFESAQEDPSCLTFIQGFSEYRDQLWSTVGQLAEGHFVCNWVQKHFWKTSS